MKDHEKLLRDVLRVRFQTLVDRFKDSQSGIEARINEMGIEQFITDTKAIADKFPCLWDLVTEMESDLMSEVTK
jgi:hypothetical protein